MKKEFEPRSAYRHFLTIATRWHDNDLYGHVNNVVYYSYFDTIVNTYLIENGGLDIHNDPVIGVVVETMCSYRKSITFPEIITAGLRVAHLGKSSVRHEIAIFNQKEERAIAAGYFIHAFIDRSKNKPVPIPPRIRDALRAIAIEDS